MKHNFIKVAALTPVMKVADCYNNAKKIIEECKNAAEQGAVVIALPETSITGYTCADLFFQNTLQKSALDAVLQIANETKQLNSVIFVGAPFVYNGALYNCAFCLNKGKIIGIVPKTHLPNYAEFYESRNFTPAPATNLKVNVNGESVLFGTKIIFTAKNNENIKIAVEICEDLWAPLPPSTHHCLAGANVIVNLSASSETVGKADYRRELVRGLSARLMCAYIYSDSGQGESTTDVVFAGHNIIAENGHIIKQNELFKYEQAISEIDVEYLENERIKNTTFNVIQSNEYCNVYFEVEQKDTVLTRNISKTPFVPVEQSGKNTRCSEILEIQAHGLAKRLKHINCNTAVVGVSGGLDSCIALLVAVKAFEITKKPVKDIIAITMPCFGTTSRTRTNAQKLCEALGVTFLQKDITETVRSNFNDIEHDENMHDITFENAQARVRTLLLMNYANKHGGIVVGTGDLSELALGWATYNGDHMSMYGVNTSVPKTLIKHMVEHIALTQQNIELKNVLLDILDTPVSPELLPTDNDSTSQQTEDIVGPYILHDFFIYYMVRQNFTPEKIYHIAKYAFKGEFDDETILKWLNIFCKRFFAQQFKRNCIPDGPKVGSVSLSPRGDFRMPSDADATCWINSLNNN